MDTRGKRAGAVAIGRQLAILPEPNNDIDNEDRSILAYSYIREPGINIPDLYPGEWLRVAAPAGLRVAPNRLT